MPSKSPLPMPSLDLLHSLFEFKDGVLVWRVKPEGHFKDPAYQRAWNTKFAGKPAGTTRADGYVVTTVSGRPKLVHRIAFYLAHGFCPAKIDHIDGDPSNNRIENLREANDSQNCWNMALGTKNTSGVKGVTWHIRDKRWQAQVKVNDKMTHLGQFRELEDAKAAVINYRKIHHGEFANDG